MEAIFTFLKILGQHSSWFGIKDKVFDGAAQPDSLDVFRDRVIGIVNYMGGFAAFVAIVIFIYGAVKWMTAGGDNEKVESARKTVTAALAGLLVVALTEVIINLVLTRLGVL